MRNETSRGIQGKRGRIGIRKRMRGNKNMRNYTIRRI